MPGVKGKLMKILSGVPHIAQFDERACGIAALEMVYRYFRPSKLTKFSQQKVYANLETDTPDKSDKEVRGDKIVEYAQKRAFQSGWGRVDPEPKRLVQQVQFFTEEERLPLIVCQQWQVDPSRGHFRVVIGIDHDEVIFHDPAGGANLRLPLSDFIFQWRQVPGGSVTGGVAIWIADRKIESPLDPDQPNLWLSLHL
jgi:ABC-type bacteriocin/lantibiotic exporter with double-glycine peptidase domain